MRILHTADWHLGQDLYGFDRGHEHDVFLAWLVDLLRERAVDALIVAGDIFDGVNPPVAALNRFYDFLRRLAVDLPDLDVVMVAGNHDSAARLELPRPFLAGSRRHLVGALARDGRAPDPGRALIPLHDRDGAVAAWCAAVPYLRPADLPPGERPVAAVYDVLAAAAPGDRPVIAAGHLHLAGGAVSELSERRILVGGEAALGADLFTDRWAYVALGHLHRPQRVARDTIRYAGAPFPMSMAEKDYRHSVAVVDLDEDGVTGVELVETPRPVPFLRLPARGSHDLPQAETELAALDLADPGPECRPWLEVAVRLDGPAPDMRSRIDRALDGKPVRLTRVVRETAATGTAPEPAPGLDDLTPEALFVRRHREAYGTDPADDILTAFRTLAVAVAEDRAP